MALTDDETRIKRHGGDRREDRRRAPAQFCVDEAERRRKQGQPQSAVEEIARDASARFTETLKRLGQ